jgi:putative ABC transport system ATP-binding protein
MIKLENISLARGDKSLLEDVSLTVEQGEQIVLSGPSGCGKSSLLGAIVGCFPLQSGSIKVDNQELKKTNLHEIRHLVAFIGQEPVMGAETVKDAIMLPFTFKANRHTPPDQARIHKTLEQLQLTPDIMEKACSDISGGEKQRLAIVRALLMDKKIFLADEVTSALDPNSFDAVVKAFTELDISSISVSHDPRWLETQNRIYEFNDRQLILKAQPEQQ